MTTSQPGFGRLRAIFRSRLLHAGIAVGCVVVAGQNWSAHLNAEPRVNIPPTAPLPVPNAYDELLRIGGRNIEPSPELWEATSAVNGSMPAGAPPSGPPPSGSPTRAGKQARPTVHYNTDADRRAALARAEPALTELRAALARHTAYHAPYRRGLGDYDTGWGKIESLADSLAFESRLRAHDGDAVGAADSGLLAVQLGAIVPTGGGENPHIRGSSIEAIGRRTLWDFVDRLDADRAADAARRLESIDASRPPLADSLTEEKWIALSHMVALLKNATTAQATSQMSGAPAWSESGGHWNLFEMYSGGDSDSRDLPPESAADQAKTRREMLREACELLTHSKQDILDNADGTLDARIAQSRLPFPDLRSIVAPAHDPITRALLLDDGDLWVHVAFRDAADRMQARLLAAAFALRAYKLRHNDYPTSLSDVVANRLLRAVPDDPFAPTAGTPLRFRRLDSTHFLLYSVGPDGLDDGGRPANARTDDGKPRHSPLATDKGDWVYGVNTHAADPLPQP